MKEIMITLSYIISIVCSIIITNNYDYILINKLEFEAFTLPLLASSILIIYYARKINKLYLDRRNVDSNFLLLNK